MIPEMSLVSTILTFIRDAMRKRPSRSSFNDSISSADKSVSIGIILYLSPKEQNERICIQLSLVSHDSSLVIVLIGRIVVLKDRGREREEIG